MSNRVIRPLPTDQVNLNSQESMHSATASFDDKPRKQLEDPLLSSVAPLEDNTRFAIKLAKEATMGKDKPSPENQTPETSQRYLIAILLLNLMVCFGMNYVYDAPQALEDPLIRGLKIDTLKISMMYAIYSLPNIFLTPFVGIFIARLGCHNAIVAYSTLVFMGSCVVYVGINHNTFWLILVGRAICGIGGEGIRIIQLTINELWFFGHFLSASVAWCEIFENVADSMGNILHTEILITFRTLNAPFFAMSLMCFFSAGLSIVYYFQHLAHEDKIKRGPGSDDEFDNHTASSIINISADEKSDISESMQVPKTGVFMSPEFRNTGGLKIPTIPENDSAEGMVSVAMHAEDEVTIEMEEEEIIFGFSSIKYYGSMFWLLCAVAVFLLNCYRQVISIMTEILQNRYMYQFSEANSYTVVPQITAIAIAPFLSRWIETKGYKPAFLLISAFCFLTAFISLYLLPPEPSVFITPLFALIGVAYAIITCALFSSVALAVPQAGVGMAFSILMLTENIGTTLLPLVFGHLAAERSVEAYDDCLLTLVVLATASVILSTALLIYDSKTTRLLALPENSVKVKRIRHKMDSQFIERSRFEISVMLNRSTVAQSPDQDLNRKKIRKTVSFQV